MLVLLDRDAKANRLAASGLRASGKIRVLDFALDLRDRPAIDAAFTAARAELGR